MKKKIIKKNSIYVVLVAGTAITFASLGFIPKEEKSNYARATAEFSGQSIFKGIFFGDKKVGAFIPEISDERNYKGSAAGLDQFIKKIEAIDADFFSSFKLSMESGNPIKVEQALNDANKILSKIVTVKIASQKNGTEETMVAIIGQTASTDITWVPGPLNNLATAVSTDGLPGPTLDREKAISYLANSLKK
ncbi:hypothetical protein GCM10022289_00370 [Pedobacter jeongneungensis]|uniref:SdpC family antimicrobial peptide n=1 Tax=Pedobacter jeongneungensis TaxID=947309 RepID=A0ABP8B1I1_9SPHI